MIRSTKIFLSLFSFLLAQSDMELGITAYNKRAEGSTGATAQRGPIDEAINYFGKAAKSPENELPDRTRIIDISMNSIDILIMQSFLILSTISRLHL